MTTKAFSSLEDGGPACTTVTATTARITRSELCYALARASGLDIESVSGRIRGFACTICNQTLPSGTSFILDLSFEDEEVHVGHTGCMHKGESPSFVLGRAGEKTSLTDEECEKLLNLLREQGILQDVVQPEQAVPTPRTSPPKFRQKQRYVNEHGGVRIRH